MKPIGATRTTKQANERMIDLLLDMGDMERLAILHTNAEEEARQFLSSLTIDVPPDPLVVNITTVIGTHTGPNGLGFATVIQA